MLEPWWPCPHRAALAATLTRARPALASRKVILPYPTARFCSASSTFQLRAGRYFGEPRTLAADTVVAVLDVVGSDGSDREFARREVTWGEIRFDAFESFTLRIDAALPVSALECRIYSTGACELEAPPVLRMDREEAGEKVLELRLTTVSG